MDYTKGTWAVEKWGHNTVIVTDADQTDSEICVISKHGLPFEANAHLIAAAPAMYEALKGIRKDVDKPKPLVFDELESETLIKVYKAISAAEGK